MKNKAITRSARSDLINYIIICAAFILITVLKNNGALSRSQQGLLVPICCYIVMAISLNLVVGILGDLSLGHAGFMSVGAFTGVITAMSLATAIPSAPLRLALAMLVGAFFAAVVGALVGIPVLRLNGDYLAIVTLAFGEILKELITCLIVGVDGRGLHIIFNFNGAKSANDLNLLDDGRVIIKGAQGATGTQMIATFTAGFILIMLTLLIVQNLVRSRHGRAIMAVRDNRIAAESVGINITKYKMMAFVTSAALAGAAGALFGLNYSNLAAAKFDFNTSILVLVFVVLGGLGNIRGSIIATVVLYILPEVLRGFANYRMLIYAVVLILVMLTTNNPILQGYFARIRESFGKRKDKEVQDA